jgi:hypothetical protein
MDSLPSHSLRTRVIQFESRLVGSVMGIGISLKSHRHPHRRDKIFTNMFALSAQVCDMIFAYSRRRFSQALCIHNGELYALDTRWFSLSRRCLVTNCQGARERHAAPARVSIRTTFSELRLFEFAGFRPRPNGPTAWPEPTVRQRPAPRPAWWDRYRRPEPCRGVRRRGRRSSVPPHLRDRLL